MLKGRNLFLIGYRGSGKSAVAPLLAEALCWQAVDTDEQIQIVTGRSIADIFRDEGEAAFRQWETTVLQAHALRNEQVISLGGGAPTVEINRSIMKTAGRAVWLTAPPEVLWARIIADPATTTQRPSLLPNSQHLQQPTGTNSPTSGLDEIRLLLEQRESIYNECADYIVDTRSMSPEQIADQIANWWDPVDR